MTQWKTIGILGGARPWGTLYFHHTILELVRGMGSSTYPHIVIDSNPAIPDHETHLCSDGPSPLPALQRSLGRLVDAGVGVIAVPTGSAHAYYMELARAAPVPVINMVGQTMRRLLTEVPHSKRIGLVVTDVMRKQGLYEESLHAIGREVVYPPDPFASKISEAICGRGGLREGHLAPVKIAIRDTLIWFARAQVDAVIVGCAETSFSIPTDTLPFRVIYPIEILAMETLTVAATSPLDAEVALAQVSPVAPA